ncbi:MAG: AbrB/MazE/SpoVT family DNA-binding domain-containing protein [Thermomicrobiales bacterium]
MAHRIGAKGQVVIAKEIRDELGIGPGWETIQRLVDGHVELSFVPPEHNRSLLGALSAHANPALATSDLHDVKEAAWDAIAREGEEYRQQTPSNGREG